MDEELEKKFQDSEIEWSEIKKAESMRMKKDQRIISEYCAKNNQADVYNTLRLLEKYPGMHSYDEEIISAFRENYPKTLTLEIIHAYEDLKDIYQEYLEHGEEEQ